MALNVPYRPIPDVVPQSPGESISVATPEAAFGVNIGNALQHLGSSTAEAGNEIFSRAIAIQDLTNQADARNAVSKMMDTMAQSRAQYLSTKEKDAVNGLQPYLDQSNQTHKEIRSTLTSPMAQRYFDQEASFFMRNNVIAASGHAATEGKAYVTGTAASRVWLASENMTDPKSDIEFAHRQQVMRENAQVYANENGLSDEQYQEYLLKANSNAWVKRIEQIATTDPQGALGMYNRAVENGQITADAQPQIHKLIQNRNNVIGAKVLADDIYGDGTKPSQEMFDEAKKRAPPISMGDPEFEQHVESAIRTRMIYDRGAITQQRQQANNDINLQITRSSPHSLQELLVQPGMQAAYNALSPREQREVPGWIESWGKKKDAYANYLEYYKLRSQAVEDPAGFLAQDPSSWKVGPQQQAALLETRSRIAKGEEVDPHYRQAADFMKRNFGSQLTALGIYSRNKDSPEEYDKYSGALFQALNAWMETHNGKPPSDNEMYEIGKALIINTHPEPGWFFGLNSTQKPIYDVPQSVIDEVTPKVRAITPGATDDEIHRAALRQIFKTIFGGSGGGSATKPGQSGPPVPSPSAD